MGVTGSYCHCELLFARGEIVSWQLYRKSMWLSQDTITCTNMCGTTSGCYKDPGLSLQMLDHHPDTKWPWWPRRPYYHLAPKPAGGHVTHLDAKLETSWRLDHHPDNSLYGGVVYHEISLAVMHEALSLKFKLTAVQIYCHYISKLKVKYFFKFKCQPISFIYLFMWHDSFSLPT